MMHKNRVLGAALALSLAFGAGSVHAQGAGLTIGAGMGAILNENRDLPDDFDDLTHKLGFVSLRIPMFPIGLRAEGLWPGDPFEDGPRAFIASGVLALPLPVLSPYAQLGWGDYNFGDPERSKWSAGVGVQLNLGTLGIFVEATRYNRMNTDLITGGLTFRTGGS
jgi:hypothetical protein